MKNFIKLKNVSLKFPIYDYYKQSIKLKTLNYLTGGKIEHTENKRFIQALENINLEIQDSDRIGLYGHNGSGKTTLLRVLAGIFHPTEGYVETHGVINSMLSIDLGVDLYLNGIENIKLKAKFLKLNEKETEDMLQYVSEFSELGEFLEMPLATYSSGMKVRLQFALATYNKSGIVLLDEWLSAGDEKFKPKAEKKMLEVVEDSGIFVMASHNIERLKSVCNKIVYMEKGRIAKIEKI